MMMESQTYRTCIGCCTTPAEELLVEALYATPTTELAAEVATLVNARGYNVSAQELLDDLYD